MRGPTDIAEFARQKLAWCRRFVPLRNGVPSHDTIGRVIALLKPGQFQRAFMDWVLSFTAAQDAIDGPQFVSIDGKTLRGSQGAKDRGNPLHLVAPGRAPQGLTLGQVAVDEKSNEITAIPKLLEMLELKGGDRQHRCDGMPKRDRSADRGRRRRFSVGGKGQPAELVAAISAFFCSGHEHNDFAAHGCRQYHTREKSRGRLEERSYLLAPLPETMPVSVRLAGLVFHRASRQPHDRGW